MKYVTHYVLSTGSQVANLINVRERDASAKLKLEEGFMKQHEARLLPELKDGQPIKLNSLLIKPGAIMYIRKLKYKIVARLVSMRFILVANTPNPPLPQSVHVLSQPVFYCLYSSVVMLIHC
jgi:hypothetical protein